ncbi:hypothetical protein GF354_00220 [Candidatus Peregrinibacteria bacterium]|nr:hypothetical protein [Candidatus Peregrinibacteria bacterium]
MKNNIEKFGIDESYINELGDEEISDTQRVVRGNLSLVGEGSGLAERKRGLENIGLTAGTVFSYEIRDGLDFYLDVAPISFLSASEENGKLNIHGNGIDKSLNPGEIVLVGSDVDLDKDIEINDVSIAPHHLRIKYAGNGMLEVVNLDDRESAHGVRLKYTSK